jgi:hypothetical protein
MNFKIFREVVIKRYEIFLIFLILFHYFLFLWNFGFDILLLKDLIEVFIWRNIDHLMIKFNLPLINIFFLYFMRLINLINIR